MYNVQSDYLKLRHLCHNKVDEHILHPTNYHFVVTGRLFKIYSLRNFEVHSAVLLTVVSMLYLRPLEVTHLITGRMCPLTNISPLSLRPALGKHLPLSASEFSDFRFYM